MADAHQVLEDAERRFNLLQREFLILDDHNVSARQRIRNGSRISKDLEELLVAFIDKIQSVPNLSPEEDRRSRELDQDIIDLQRQVDEKVLEFERGLPLRSRAARAVERTTESALDVTGESALAVGEAVAEDFRRGRDATRRIAAVAGPAIKGAARSFSNSSIEAAKRASGAIGSAAGSVRDSSKAAAEKVSGAIGSAATSVRDATIYGIAGVGDLGSRGVDTVRRAGAAVSPKIDRALIRAGDIVDAAGTKIGDAITRARTPSPPRPVPLDGDPDFFPRLLNAQSALEAFRSVEALFTSAGLSGNLRKRIEDILKVAEEAARETVASTMRFAAEKVGSPAIPANLPKIITIAVDEMKGAAADLREIINAGHLEDAKEDRLHIVLDAAKSAISGLRNRGITEEGAELTRFGEHIIKEIQRSIPPILASINLDQFNLITRYDAVAIRNYIAKDIGQPLMAYPTISDPALIPAIASASQRANQLAKSAISPTTDVLKSPKKPREWSNPFADKGPTVRDLGSAFGDKAAGLLKRSGLAQSPEMTQALIEKRATQLKSSLPLSYTSDIDGKSPPFIPTEVIDSLLPFVLMADILLKTRPNSTDGSPEVSPVSLDQMRAIESMMELTLLMSDPRRGLADNLESTFGASDFGYFLDPSGIKILERITQVISEIPKWTKKIADMTPPKTSEKEIIYAEKAMLSVGSVIADYCSVCRPQSDGVCSLLPEFSSGADNKIRVEALRKIASRALTANSRSVLGTPLLGLCDAIDRLMTNGNNVRSREKSLGEKLEKHEGTAEERVVRSIDAIRKLLGPVNYNDTGRLIDWSIVKPFLDHLENIVRDLVVIEKAERAKDEDRADEIQNLVNDLRVALTQAREHSEYQAKVTPWVESKRIVSPTIDLPSWSIGEKFGDELRKNDRLKNLYRDVNFVVGSTVKRDFAQALRSKPGEAKVLPAAATKEFALSNPGLQKLPQVIVKDALVNALARSGLADTREWYDNLGKALTDIYGDQTVRSKIDYEAIAKAVTGRTTVEDMEEALIEVALPELVKTLLAGRSSPSNIDVSKLGQEIYKILPQSGLSLGTEALAKAIVDVAPRIPEGVKIPSDVAAQSLVDVAKSAVQSGQKPEVSNLTRALIAEATSSGIQDVSLSLDAVQDRQLGVQERIAAAIARVGGFTGDSPPAWTGVSV